MAINNPSYFNQLKNKMIRIYHGPPGFRKGRPIAIINDYFVFLTEDNEYLYCQTSHVKSIIHNSFHEIVPVSTIDNPISSYLNADSFQGVLQKMMYRQVQVDEGSRNGIKGIICNIFADHIDLVCEHEVIKVYTYHIKSVRYAAAIMSDSKKTNEQETKSEVKQEETVEPQSSDTVSEMQHNYTVNSPINDVNVKNDNVPKTEALQTRANTENNTNYKKDSVQPQPQPQPQLQPQNKNKKVRRLRKRKIRRVIVKKRKIGKKKQNKTVLKIKKKQFIINNTFKGMPKKKTCCIQKASKARRGSLSYSVYTF